jgi:hypothetical protein
MRRLALFMVGALAAAACSKAPENGTNDAAATANVPTAEANAALPDDRTPLPEPSGPIDPKSAEAAGQVVQSFGALIEQRRWAEAEALWDDSGTATQFTANLKRYPEAHLEIGAPGEPEGAAGSIYVTVPVVFYGKQTGGDDFRRAADIILRRVNDVPGSTEAQRRWHIERIDCKA